MVTLNTTMPTEKGSSTGLILLGLALAAGVGYYFLVYQPEQEKLRANN